MNVWRKLKSILGAMGRTSSSRRRNGRRLLLVGLNNAGKSTLLNRLKSDRDQLPRKMIGPTVGFAVDKFVFNGVKFTVNDMSGRDGYRNMWESMYGQCDAIVFVVDSTDQLRFAVVSDELDMMLRHPDVADRPDVPILFAANKTAAPDSCGAAAVAAALRLHERLGPDRPWRLVNTDAVVASADDGLREALEWLTGLVKASRPRSRDAEVATIY